MFEFDLVENPASDEYHMDPTVRRGWDTASDMR